GFPEQPWVDGERHADGRASHFAGCGLNRPTELFLQVLLCVEIRHADGKLVAVEAEVRPRGEPELVALFADPLDDCALQRSNRNTCPYGDRHESAIRSCSLVVAQINPAAASKRAHGCDSLPGLGRAYYARNRPQVGEASGMNWWLKAVANG